MGEKTVDGAKRKRRRSPLESEEDEARTSSSERKGVNYDDRRAEASGALCSGSGNGTKEDESKGAQT